MQFIDEFPALLFATFFDILPIAFIIFGFQFLVIRKRVKNLKKVLIGMVYVLSLLAVESRWSRRCFLSAAVWPSS